MPVRFDISIVQVGKSLKVTIPKEIVEQLKLRKGEHIWMSTDNNHIIIEKKEKP